MKHYKSLFLLISSEHMYVQIPNPLIRVISSKVELQMCIILCKYNMSGLSQSDRNEELHPLVSLILNVPEGGGNDLCEQRKS